VASTTVGIDPFGRLRLTIRSEQLLGLDHRYRLIVQSYADDYFEGGELPAPYDRPTASAQRSVSGEELAEGVDVVLVEPRQGVQCVDRVVFAWIETGDADLEFDAAHARPIDAGFLGTATMGASDRRADICLRRAAA
jgi:hypothetical protein